MLKKRSWAFVCGCLVVLLPMVLAAGPASLRNRRAYLLHFLSCHTRAHPVGHRVGQGNRKANQRRGQDQHVSRRHPDPGRPVLRRCGQGNFRHRHVCPQLHERTVPPHRGHRPSSGLQERLSGNAICAMRIMRNLSQKSLLTPK